jgi:hypothetical protein
MSKRSVLGALDNLLFGFNLECVFLDFPDFLKIGLCWVGYDLENSYFSCLNFHYLFRYIHPSFVLDTSETNF